mmetsp:Transcript_42794/g.89880  ORF Transcript_42794/g.89880 Transcript_42794/m.89880 type:complete len:233 (+) Transcript_42794:2587-3285(+)
MYCWSAALDFVASSFSTSTFSTMVSFSCELDLQRRLLLSFFSLAFVSLAETIAASLSIELRCPSFPKSSSQLPLPMSCPLNSKSSSESSSSFDFHCRSLLLLPNAFGWNEHRPRRKASILSIRSFFLSLLPVEGMVLRSTLALLIASLGGCVSCVAGVVSSAIITASLEVASSATTGAASVIAMLLPLTASLASPTLLGIEQLLEILSGKTVHFSRCFISIHFSGHPHGGYL